MRDNLLHIFFRFSLNVNLNVNLREIEIKFFRLFRTEHVFNELYRITQLIFTN